MALVPLRFAVIPSKMTYTEGQIACLCASSFWTTPAPYGFMISWDISFSGRWRNLSKSRTYWALLRYRALKSEVANTASELQIMRPMGDGPPAEGGAGRGLRQEQNRIQINGIFKFIISRYWLECTFNILWQWLRYEYHDQCSLIAGDGSLAPCLAHEIGHSCFGLSIGAMDWTEEWPEREASLPSWKIRYKQCLKGSVMCWLRCSVPCIKT